MIRQWSDGRPTASNGANRVCDYFRLRRDSGAAAGGQSGPHSWSAEWQKDSSRRGSSPHPISGMRLFQDIASSGKEAPCPPYSSRKATIGLTLMARRAGM
jgi:hypothetical protein